MLFKFRVISRYIVIITGEYRVILLIFMNNLKLIRDFSSHLKINFSIYVCIYVYVILWNSNHDHGCTTLLWSITHGNIQHARVLVPSHARPRGNVSRRLNY